MKIITTHISPDYDAFASMMLAHKIYHDYIPVIPSGITNNLRNLMSLYKGVFPVHTKKILKNQIIDVLVVVDTRKISRIKELKNNINQNTQIIIYDHHPPAAEDIVTNLDFYKSRGSASTILCEELLVRSDMKLTPEEASLALLGIYADTGSLIFPSTTPEDLEIVAKLLRMGGNLKFVKEYLQATSVEQFKGLYYQMLERREFLDYHGYKVVFVKIKLDTYVKGLSTVLQYISDVEGADAIFGIFHLETREKTYIIGQTSIDFIEINKLMNNFGGGGHYAVGAATLDDKGDLDKIQQEILDFLDEASNKMATVESIMKKNVIFIRETESCERAENILISYNIHGAPVLNDNDELKGVITVSDLEKAENSNLLHAPVKAFMNKNVVFINKNVPINYAKKLIVEKNASHLPIMDNGTIIGILSRTDIIHYLFRREKEYHHG